MNNRGYTLVEGLLALAIAITSCTLLYSMSRGIVQLSQNLNPIRTRALTQMRRYYALGKHHDWQSNRWKFEYNNQHFEVVYHERRVLITPGWQVVMDQIDDFSFFGQDACLWVDWRDGTQRVQAVVGCE